MEKPEKAKRLLRQKRKRESRSKARTSADFERIE